MKRLTTVLFLIVQPVGVVGQEFTTLELEGMVKAGFAGCMHTQLNHPYKPGAERVILERYCRCAAQKLVARTTRAEAAALKNNKEMASPAMIANAHHVGLECRAELAR